MARIHPAAAVLFPLIVVGVSGCESKQQPDPERILREMSEFLGERQEYGCEMTSVMEMRVPGMDNRQETQSAIRLRRPNQFALVTSGASTVGPNLVSDGTTLIQHLPILNQYSKGDAPARVSDIFDEDALAVLMMMGPSAGLIPYGGEAFFQRLMEGVDDSSYIGKEMLDQSECHVCQFSQQEFSWKIWIQTGQRPLPRKVEFDMGAQMKEAAEMFEGAEFKFLARFDAWNLEPGYTDADFQFDPPDQATEVANLMEAMMGGGGSEEPMIHPLLGKPAPRFKAANLQGQEIDLESLVGKDVVILDFWATWCGPCVRAMPEIAAVAEQYADRGVRFFAVNVGEEADDISEFLESAELDINVLLDSDGDISSQYQADAIPQTVLIGKSGIVQVVHVGMSANLREELSGQLDQLLAGENLAEKALAEAEMKQEQLRKEAEAASFGVTQAWTVAGPWQSVAVDMDSSTIYATSLDKQLTSVTADGVAAKPSEIRQGGIVRLANLVKDDPPQLVTFGPWGQKVQAMQRSGAALWDYTLGQGLDDVWPIDLDSDGRDEVIVGYNGDTGLHLLDHNGKLLWKYTRIGNVWHVTGGDFDGRPGMEVITTSARGAVHVFDLEGNKTKDIDVPIYANTVRMAPAHAGLPPQVVVAGSGDDGESVLTVDYAGNVDMLRALPNSRHGHVEDVAVAAPQRWAAVAMRGGVVHVVDLAEGTIIATAAGQGSMPHVAWCPRPDQAPLLIVATGKALNGLRIEPSGDPPTD